MVVGQEPWALFLRSRRVVGIVAPLLIDAAVLSKPDADGAHPRRCRTIAMQGIMVVENVTQLALVGLESLGSIAGWRGCRPQAIDPVRDRRWQSYLLRESCSGRLPIATRAVIAFTDTGPRRVGKHTLRFESPTILQQERCNMLAVESHGTRAVAADAKPRAAALGNERHALRVRPAARFLHAARDPQAVGGSIDYAYSLVCPHAPPAIQRTSIECLPQLVFNESKLHA